MTANRFQVTGETCSKLPRDWTAALTRYFSRLVTRLAWAKRYGAQNTSSISNSDVILSVAEFVFNRR